VYHVVGAAQPELERFGALSAGGQGEFVPVPDEAAVLVSVRCVFRIRRRKSLFLNGQMDGEIRTYGKMQRHSVSSVFLTGKQELTLVVHLFFLPPPFGG
jgi:hypothetical protein